MSRTMHCTEPCDLGKALAEANIVMVRAIHERGSLSPASSLLKKCPVGLTSRQATFLAVVHGRQNSIISYAEIAELCNTLWGIAPTKIAIREYSDKLKKRGFFNCCELAREGILQGMKIVFSQKCCPFLRLPPAPAHTPTHAVASPPALSPALPEPLPPPPTQGNTATLTPPQAPLLQEKKKKEEESYILLFNEKRPKATLPTDLNCLTAEQYAKSWPTLMKIGFDFPAFKNAAKKAPDQEMLLETWRQSLDYAEFAWQVPQSVKDANGIPVRVAHVWIAGCFKKNSHYPRPANYKTPEEITQERVKREAQEQDFEHCTAAYQKWRSNQSAEEIKKLLFGDWRFGFKPPENIIEERFQKRLWPEIKKQEELQSD